MGISFAGVGMNDEDLWARCRQHKGWSPVQHLRRVYPILRLIFQLETAFDRRLQDLLGGRGIVQRLLPGRRLYGREDRRFRTRLIGNGGKLRLLRFQKQHILHSLLRWSRAQTSGQFAVLAVHQLQSRRRQHSRNQSHSPAQIPLPFPAPYKLGLPGNPSSPYAGRAAFMRDIGRVFSAQKTFRKLLIEITRRK